MPKATPTLSKHRAAPYPAPRSPLQAKDTNLCPHHAAKRGLKDPEKAYSTGLAPQYEPPPNERGNHGSDGTPLKPFSLSNRPNTDPNATADSPPRLPSPTIPKSAKSFLDIELPTLPNSSLPPIYDTCTQLRQKINKLINNKNPDPEDGMPGEFKKDGSPKPWTIKAFCEAIGGVSSGSYNKFMRKTGAMAGAANGVYSTGYIFFEKKRIWEKKPKTQARNKVEEENPMGLAVEDDTSQSTVTKAIGNRGTGRRRRILTKMPNGSIRRV